MSKLAIVVENADRSADQKSATLGVYDDLKTKVKEFDIVVLKKSMANLSNCISTVFADIKNVGNFKLKEIKLEVEISAAGGFNLVGTATAGTKGAISLTFVEDDSSQKLTK